MYLKDFRFAPEGDDCVRVRATIDSECLSKAISLACTRYIAKNNIKQEPGQQEDRTVKKLLGEDSFDAFLSKEIPEQIYPYVLDHLDFFAILEPEYINCPTPTTGEDYSFEVLVHKEPIYELSSYDPVHIKLHEPSVSDDEVDACISSIARTRYPYKREANSCLHENDNAVISLDVYKNDALIATRKRIFLQLGTGAMSESFEQNLYGMSEGERRSFEYEDDYYRDGLFKTGTTTYHADVYLAEVHKTIPQEINDEWVATHFPMQETLLGLKEWMKEQMISAKAERKINGCASEFEQAQEFIAAGELARRLIGEIPECYVDYMVTYMDKNPRDDDFSGCLQKFKPYLVDYDFIDNKRNVATEVLRRSFAIDAYYDYYGLRFDPDDVGEVCKRVFADDPESVRKGYEATGMVHELEHEARKIRALEHLVENAEITVIP